MTYEGVDLIASLSADEYVVFIAPSSLQLAIFEKLLTPTMLRAFIKGPSAQALALSGWMNVVNQV